MKYEFQGTVDMNEIHISDAVICIPKPEMKCHTNPFVSVRDSTAE